MCLRVWHRSVQWLPQAPPLLPPSLPLCLRISIMKPSTLCSTTWECCLLVGHRCWPQLQVRRKTFLSVDVVFKHNLSEVIASVWKWSAEMRWPYVLKGDTAPSWRATTVKDKDPVLVLSVVSSCSVRRICSSKPHTCAFTQHINRVVYTCMHASKILRVRRQVATCLPAQFGPLWLWHGNTFRDWCAHLNVTVMNCL